MRISVVLLLVLVESFAVKAQECRPNYYPLPKDAGDCGTDACTRWCAIRKVEGCDKCGVRDCKDHYYPLKRDWKDCGVMRCARKCADVRGGKACDKCGKCQRNFYPSHKHLEDCGMTACERECIPKRGEQCDKCGNIECQRGRYPLHKHAADCGMTACERQCSLNCDDCGYTDCRGNHYSSGANEKTCGMNACEHKCNATEGQQCGFCGNLECLQDVKGDWAMSNGTAKENLLVKLVKSDSNDLTGIRQAAYSRSDNCIVTVKICLDIPKKSYPCQKCKKKQDTSPTTQFDISKLQALFNMQAIRMPFNKDEELQFFLTIHNSYIVVYYGLATVDLTNQKFPTTVQVEIKDKDNIENRNITAMLDIQCNKDFDGPLCQFHCSEENVCQDSNGMTKCRTNFYPDIASTAQCGKKMCAIQCVPSNTGDCGPCGALVCKLGFTGDACDKIDRGTTTIKMRKSSLETTKQSTVDMNKKSDTSAPTNIKKDKENGGRMETSCMFTVAVLGILKKLIEI